MKSWLGPWAAATSYPLFIASFPIAMASYRETGNAMFAGLALLSMLIAGSVPLLAGWTLYRTGNHAEAWRVRAVLCLAFAVSPLYVLSVLVAWMSGFGHHHAALWVALWLLAGALLYFQPDTAGPDRSQAPPGWQRFLHGGAALALLAGFLLAHIFNHVLAAWSVALHTATMKVLREWYRAPWVETGLLALCLAMAATGLPMLRRFAGQKLDAFRAVQLGTGAYLGVFLCSHLLAVLGGRRTGSETDWIFAAGRHGLLRGDGMLIPYYTLAVFFLVVHCGCGLRIVLLKHGTQQAWADRSVYLAAAAGMVTTIVIAAALFDFHAKQ